MVPFFTQLETAVANKDSRLCVGIDPHDYLIQNTPGETIEEQLINWALDLARQTAPHAACFKINIAFFEAYGSAGIRALEQIIPSVQALAPLILDAKRGDISSTAAAYAKACLETWNVQGITINPYLGMQSFAPFLAYPQAGLFLLCHTSNPSAQWLQRRRSDDDLALYEWIAKESAAHPQAAQLGLVVGATQSDVVEKIRTVAPSTWLLCPGVGAQGGSLIDIVHKGWGAKGNLLISASRSIAKSPNPAQAAEQLKNAIRTAAPKSSLSAAHRHLAELLIKAQCVLFGQFTLKSGLQSPIYIDLRKITGHPETFAATIDAYCSRIQELQPEAIAALPLAGLPIASGIALQQKIPLCYPRPPKQHGTQKSIEGGVPHGSHVLLIDDLATRGASAIAALPNIRSQYKSSDLLVLIDRGSGAKQRLAEHGITLHAIFSLEMLLEYWKEVDLISAQQYQLVLQFLASST